MEHKLVGQIQVLQKALDALSEAVALEPTRIHKDATIQRFEFSFELIWKMLQTYVRDQGIEVFAPRNVFREAHRLNVIDNLNVWFAYLQARNSTTHVYNEQMADEIYMQAKTFVSAANTVIEKVMELYDAA